jgi:hypothetical protein
MEVNVITVIGNACSAIKMTARSNSISNNTNMDLKMTENSKLSVSTQSYKYNAFLR